MQVVVSTHDRDLLLGLIDADESSVVNVVRITRDANINHFRHLSAVEISATWEAPVLRYSNVLQGLFHARAVITESDADCRFYRAALDQLGSDNNRRAVADDVLFVPSGGKQRIATMATALTSLGVETFAIADFDVLRQRVDVQGIVDGVGAVWTDEMNSAYVGMSSQANSDSLWDTLKKQGLAALPAGEAHNNGQQLLKMLRDVGVLVVPVGEMEDFDKSIGLHGAAWVSEMLAQRKHKTCSEARQLLGPLLA